MSIATRLLIAGAFGSGFAPATVFQLTSTPGEGGWNAQSDYQAVSYNGRTYIGWVTTTGDVQIATWVSGALQDTFTLHATLQADLHVSPSILVRASDHRLVVAYTKHDENVFYVRISTNPEDTSAWGSETNLHSTLGGHTYSYPELLQRADGTLLIYYRDEQDSATSGTLCYTYSSDGGATWSAQTSLWKNSGKQAYWKVFGSGNRVDVVAIDGHPETDAPTTLYHMYADLTDWHKSDGTVISAGFPLAPSDMTQVYAGGSGSAWIHNMAIDADGHPVAAYWTGTYGAGNMDLNYAHWTGSAWESHIIVNEGGSSDVTYWLVGGAAIDELDPNIVYLSRWDGLQWEMFKYVTADHGSTWAGTQLTFGSTSAATGPAPIRDRSADLTSVWLRGTISGDLITPAVYSLVIEGTTR